MRTGGEEIPGVRRHRNWAWCVHHDRSSLVYTVILSVHIYSSTSYIVLYIEFCKGFKIQLNWNPIEPSLFKIQHLKHNPKIFNTNPKISTLFIFDIKMKRIGKYACYLGMYFFSKKCLFKMRHKNENGLTIALILTF